MTQAGTGAGPAGGEDAGGRGEQHDEQAKRSGHSPGESAAAAGRPAWSTFRAALERVGFHPSRRLGQNFLLDENMVRAIVRDAGVGPGDRVIEIGAGCGFLSLHLVRAGVELTSFEIDARLAAIARELLAGEPRFQLVHADALEGKHELHPELRAAIPVSGPWHVVSNLPYAIAGPLLVSCAELENAPRTMTVLVQREVALRIAAPAGSSDWGPLSIRLQIDYEPEIVRSVSAGLFWPRPKVESSVVRLVLRAERLARPERERFSAFVGAVFQHRRQALGRVLSDLAGGREAALRWLAAAGLQPGLRAEDLPLSDLRKLCEAGRTFRLS